MLKLNEGWEVGDNGFHPCEWIFPTGKDYRYSLAALHADGSATAYPFGNSPDNSDLDEVRFPTAEEAHAYLLSVGSESPWREFKLAFRKGYGLEKDCWGLFTVEKGGNTSVAYDPKFRSVRLYMPLTNKRVFLDAVDADADSWQDIAHRYFTERKLESPWKVVAC